MARANRPAVAAAALLTLFVFLAGRGVPERADAGIGARVTHFKVESEWVAGPHRQTLIVPRSWRRGGPLLVWLHARGGNENSVLTPALFAGLRQLGRRAPVIVVPSDDRFSFWHDRASGAWASYVIDTVIPRALALTHADPHRIAVGGISMGGFGAYNLARTYRGRFCAVGGHSPALFKPGEPRLPRSFDSGADFARHDLLTLAVRDPNAFRGPRLWLDVGRSDRFAQADIRFAGVLRKSGLPLSLHVWPGGHRPTYWHAHMAAYLRFYANALASCDQR